MYYTQDMKSSIFGELRTKKHGLCFVDLMGGGKTQKAKNLEDKHTLWNQIIEAVAHNNE